MKIDMKNNCIYTKDMVPTLYFISLKILEMTKTSKKNFFAFKTTGDYVNNEPTGINGFLMVNFFKVKGFQILVEEKNFYYAINYIRDEKIAKAYISYPRSWQLGHRDMETPKKFKDMLEFTKLHSINERDLTETSAFILNGVDKKKLKKIVEILDNNEEIKNIINFAPKNIAYIVTKDMYGRIFINNIRLSTPIYNEVNYLVFNYIYTHPNKIIRSEEILKEIKNTNPNFGTSLKNLRQVIDDIGFKGNIKKIFFPNSSKSSLFFQNPITLNSLRSGEFKEFCNFDLKKELNKIKLERKNRSRRK